MHPCIVTSPYVQAVRPIYKRSDDPISITWQSIDKYNNPKGMTLHPHYIESILKNPSIYYVYTIGNSVDIMDTTIIVFASQTHLARSHPTYTSNIISIDIFALIIFPIQPESPFPILFDLHCKLFSFWFKPQYLIPI